MGKKDDIDDSSAEEEEPTVSEESSSEQEIEKEDETESSDEEENENQKQKVLSKTDKRKGLSSNILSDQQLNIEVVKLRKTVKKCRSRLIQTIIRKARKLQSLVHVNPKNKEKADHQLELLDSVKRLSADETVKFAIIYDEKECNLIISAVTTEKANRAMARLANESALRQSVLALSKKYENWNDMITKFYPGAKTAKKKNARKLKYHTMKKVANSKKKPKEEKAKKKVETIENEEEKKEEAIGNGVLEAKKDIVIESEEIVEKVEAQSNGVQKKAKSPKKQKTERKEIQLDIPIKKSVVEKKVDSPRKTPKFQKVDPVQGNIKTAVVKKLESLSDLVQLEKSSEVEEEKEAAKANKKDSFFLSSDGQEVSSEEEEEEADDGSESEEEFEDKSYKSRKYHMRNKEETAGRRNQSFVSLQNSKSSENPKSKGRIPQKRMQTFGNDKQAPARKFFKSERSFAEEEPEKLHPSWEAKRKLSAIVIGAAPANKKIKFD